MSSLKLEPKDPSHDIRVGFDPPLRTFFITVFGPEPEDLNVNHDPLEFRDRWRREEVVEKIEQYAAPGAKRDAVVERIWDDLDPDDPAGVVKQMS